MGSRIKIAVLVLCLASVASCGEMDLVPCTSDYCIKCDDQMDNCAICAEGYYLDEEFTVCQGCENKIYNCTICSIDQAQTVTCSTCLAPYLPNVDFRECQLCGEIIMHCLGCNERAQPRDTLTCKQCSQGFELVLDDKKCDQKSTGASTILIVSAIVGGVVLVGAGFAIFKCMKKKKGSRLLDDE